MMLLLCEASFCLPSLAWPHLASHFLHCSGKYTWPGSNWRPSACETDVIATRPQVLLLRTSKAHQRACLKNDNRCCCKFTKWPRASGGLKILEGFAMSEQVCLSRYGCAPMKARPFRMRSGCDTTTPCAPCSRDWVADCLCFDKEHVWGRVSLAFWW